MSVLIKGMEMPKSCHDCEMCALVDVSEGLAYGCRVLKEMISNDGERLLNCPIFPIPPHGRLIDADALRQSIRESIDACHKWADEMRKQKNDEMAIRAEQALGTFVECSLRVKNAPTIIETEGQE